MARGRECRWVAAGAAVAAVGSYRRIFTPWQQRWGATAGEVEGPLPGDELVAEPAVQTTRAISIAAPAAAVWPWIVQLGADRGGFYSYDWLENLFGLGIRSTDRIVEDWQTRRAGDLVHGDAKGRSGWYVMDVRPDDALVLKMGDVKLGRPVERHEGIGWEFLWTFAVREEANGTTRLVVRERVGFANNWVKLILAPLGPVSFVMTRKMLAGVKSRAESA